MNYTNNSPRRSGIVNGNGYSNHPPTIIETAFSVAINGPPSLSPSLFLYFPTRAWNPALFSSFPLAGAGRRGGQTYDLEIQRRRCEQVVQRREDGGEEIYGLHGGGVLHTNWICAITGVITAGIRAITSCAHCTRHSSVPSLRLLPSLLMNDSVGPRLRVGWTADTFLVLRCWVRSDRWILHSISVIESKGYHYFTVASRYNRYSTSRRLLLPSIPHVHIYSIFAYVRL